MTLLKQSVENSSLSFNLSLAQEQLRIIKQLQTMERHKLNLKMLTARTHHRLERAQLLLSSTQSFVSAESLVDQSALAFIEQFSQIVVQQIIEQQQSYDFHCDSCYLQIEQLLIQIENQIRTTDYADGVIQEKLLAYLELLKLLTMNTRFEAVHLSQHAVSLPA